MSLPITYVAGFFDGEGSVGVYGYNTSLGKRWSLQVQTTQVDSMTTRSLLESLRTEFGGSVSWQATASGRGKLNWQIRGDVAASFLGSIAPHLTLKRDQAEVAVLWQRIREKRRRGGDGRILPMTQASAVLNEAVARLIADLKRIDPVELSSEIAVMRRCLEPTQRQIKDIDVVMADQADLVEIRHTLHQVLNYKGT